MRSSIAERISRVNYLEEDEDKDEDELKERLSSEMHERPFRRADRKRHKCKASAFKMR